MRLRFVMLMAACAATIGSGASGAIAAEKSSREVVFSGGVTTQDGTRFFVSGTEGAGLSASVDRHETWSWNSMNYASRSEARIGRNSLRGRLGQRGSANLDFEQRGRRVVYEAIPGCLRYTSIPGRFTGSVRFRGEGGYVNIVERRLRGYKLAIMETECTPDELFPRERNSAKLTVCSGGFFRGFSYQVKTVRGRTSMIVFGPQGRSAGLRTMPFAARAMRPSAFPFLDDFSSATLAPPAPFRGEAVYEDEALTGNLRWRTLSGEKVPLAPANRATLAVTDRHACSNFFTPGMASVALETGTPDAVRHALMAREYAGTR